MGNVESTLAFKTQFSQLWLQPNLTEKDPLWQSIVTPSGSHHQVFGVLSDAEIRRVRTDQPQNLESLLKLLVLQLSALLKPTGVGPTLEEQVLWTLRALERLIPFLLEDRHYAKSVEGLLWTKEAILKNLLDSLLKLSQQPGFCVPLHGQGIWTEGIGAEIVPQATKQNQYNRLELLRCLAVALSQQLFGLEPQGLDYLVSKPLSELAPFFCSLVNTGLAKSSLSLFQENPSQLSLGLALCCAVHSPAAPTPNNFRRLLSKIKAKDLDLVVNKGVQDLLSAALTFEFAQANPNFEFEQVNAACSLVSLERYSSEAAAVDLCRVLCLLLVHESKNPDWSERHAATIMPLFGPFSTVSIHLPALLDLLYNLSPYADLSPEFAAFVQSVSITTSTANKQSLAQSLRNIVTRANPQQIEALKHQSLGDEWLDKYISQTCESGERPPMANPDEMRPVEFGWTAQSMKWYNSILWGEILRLCEIKGVSPWAQTEIKMFRVERVGPRPTLRNPRGAVDAVGGMLWGWISNAVGSANAGTN